MLAWPKASSALRAWRARLRARPACARPCAPALPWADRLGDVVDAAGLERGHHVLGLGQAGHEDDRDVRGRRRRPSAGARPRSRRCPASSRRAARCRARACAARCSAALAVGRDQHRVARLRRARRAAPPGCRARRRRSAPGRRAARSRRLCTGGVMATRHRGAFAAVNARLMASSWNWRASARMCGDEAAHCGLRRLRSRRARS